MGYFNTYMHCVAQSKYNIHHFKHLVCLCVGYIIVNYSYPTVLRCARTHTSYLTEFLVPGNPPLSFHTLHRLW
jgi:hypothetical protein